MDEATAYFLRAGNYQVNSPINPLKGGEAMRPRRVISVAGLYKFFVDTERRKRGGKRLARLFPPGWLETTLNSATRTFDLYCNVYFKLSNIFLNRNIGVGYEVPAANPVESGRSLRLGKPAAAAPSSWRHS